MVSHFWFTGCAGRYHSNSSERVLHLWRRSSKRTFKIAEVEAMDILSVAQDIEGNDGLFQLPVAEIAYMEYQKSINRVIVHTPYKEYYTMGKLAFWQKSLAANGHRFMWIDRTNVVNIDCIKVMDPIRHIAYFDSSPSNNSKKCTFTSGRFMEVAEKIGVYKEVIQPI
jgi:DNA-binding LytR/AlgR family response regulator